MLRVASALPDPPFEFLDGGEPNGFDIAFTQAIARELGATWQLHPYAGDDFEGIFDLLASGAADVIASGTTRTPERAQRARFCAPYLQSGQSLAVNVEATPHVRSCDDLVGMTVGIQRGNTSQAVAQALLAQGKIASIAWYAYHDIGKALDDLDAGRIGAVIKLEPVLRALTAPRARLAVVEAGLTVEEIAYCVAPENAALAAGIERAQAALDASGVLERLGTRWFAGTTHTKVLAQARP